MNINCEGASYLNHDDRWLNQPLLDQLLNDVFDLVYCERTASVRA